MFLSFLLNLFQQSLLLFIFLFISQPLQLPQSLASSYCKPSSQRSLNNYHSFNLLIIRYLSFPQIQSCRTSRIVFHQSHMRPGLASIFSFGILPRFKIPHQILLLIIYLLLLCPFRFLVVCAFYLSIGLGYFLESV